MISIEDAQELLETYSLEEILEMNDLTIADALEFLVLEEFVTELPVNKPVTYSDWSWSKENIPVAEAQDDF